MHSKIFKLHVIIHNVHDMYDRMLLCQANSATQMIYCKFRTMQRFKTTHGVQSCNGVSSHSAWTGHAILEVGRGRKGVLTRLSSRCLQEHQGERIVLAQ